MHSPRINTFVCGIFGVLLGLLCVQAQAFDFQDVVAKAEALAKKPYEAPQPIPQFLQEFEYDQYQGIRFKPERSLWREARSRFQVMLVSPGLYYTHAVKINVIDSTGVQPVAFRKDNFSFSSDDLEKRIPPDLGYSGFKLTYPLEDPKTQNQFLVFAGASYFRGVGKGNAFGISARGLAVDTGLSSGEQFPSFVEYWLVRPSPSADALEFYGLLDGKRVAGAYRFVVRPGSPTVLDVDSVLVPREAIELLGVAPLTSMFFYGGNTPRPAVEWRPQVHDSDGLLIENGSTGEWLWRPLINPKRLQMNYFSTHNVRGFGLLQRQTQFADYQDLGARYDRRPSTWVKPQGDWGRGQVVLVELPTPNETNDNIVAFWRPDSPVLAGQMLKHAYTLSFGGPSTPDEPMGQAINTFVGGGNVIGGGAVEGAFRVIVDFAGGPLTKLPSRAAVVGNVTAMDDGEVIESFVEYVEPLRRWRLSILAKPAADRPLSLRAFLGESDKALTETWTYQLPTTDTQEFQ